MTDPQDFFNEDGTPKIVVIPLTGERICLPCELTWERCAYHKRQASSSMARGLMQTIPPDWRFSDNPHDPSNPSD